MNPKPLVYDPAFADGRFQLEILAVRWALVSLYALFFVTGVIDANTRWFFASETFIVAYHFYFTWTVWYERKRGPLPEVAQYATPFLDTAAVTLALVSVGDPLHPIWGVYFSIITGIAFFYYPIARAYAAWLTLNYAFAGVALQLREIYVPVPEMGVAMVVLLAGMANLTAYTGGERRLRTKLGKVALTDPLTNLPNRRGLEASLQRHVDASRETGRGLAILMIDVDFFKRYNDQLGHLVADGILEQIAQLLSASLHTADSVARYGGDEFVVMVADASADDGMLLAERPRNQVTRTGLCTVSVGVAYCDGECDDMDELLKLADAALRVAKQSGRNRVQGPLRLKAKVA